VASAVLRKRLGRQLEAARERAGKTREQVDAAPGLPARTTIYRIEAGLVSVKVGTVLALWRFYGLPDAEVEPLIKLAEATAKAGWVDEFTGVSEQLGMYADLEGSASQLLAYDPELIHGLLQTRDYAEALMSLAPELDQDAIRNRVAFRLERQRQIVQSGGKTKASFILGEAALRVQVGNPEIMGAQIEHLRGLSQRVSIMVRPFTAGPHRGSNNGGFAILEFADPEDPTVIYTETLAGSRMMEKTKTVTAFKERFGGLRSQSIPMEEFAP
jgi:Domain of unknown function (DUF5753)/Helix-turn-helix domain